MTTTLNFDHRVTIRMAFADRRAAMLTNWVLAHSIQSGTMAHWAARLQETNDAELAFAATVGVL